MAGHCVVRRSAAGGYRDGAARPVLRSSATTVSRRVTLADSARTACAVRRGWPSINREICTSPIRATIGCWCTTRRSMRRAASRARATRPRILSMGRVARSRPGAAIRAAQTRLLCAIRRHRRSTLRGTSILRTRGTIACSSSRKPAIRRSRRMRSQVDRTDKAECPISPTRNAPTALLAIRRRAITRCAIRAVWRSMRRGICLLPTPATTA